MKINNKQKMAIFESTIAFEPVCLKRHRHRLRGGTYDPSKKEKDDFAQLFSLPEKKMANPIICTLRFYCKRPTNHFRTGKNAGQLKEGSPKYNTNNKDLDNMVKFVLDALNNKLYVDDRQIIEINCSKHYAADSEGSIYVKFEEVF
jgi:Holliday junction resolvase RusA-like endonuclease